VDSMAKAILETLDHPKEAEQRASVFRQEIRDHLTWDHHYRKYQSLYCRLRDGGVSRSGA